MPAGISAAKARRFVGLLLAWFRANARDLPWRRTRDPYAIWISEVMLQQTQVRTVSPYWERWMRELPTIEALAAARTGRVLKLWEGLGYYSRARNLHRAAQTMVATPEARKLRRAHDSQGKARHSERAAGWSRAAERTARSDASCHAQPFPRNFDAILALPGVGRYTAGAICSIAFNQPKPVLDGNVTRVLTRLFGIATNARERKATERLWQLAEQLVTAASRLADPKQTNCSHLNQSLMELGATVCTPRQPQCPCCPLRSACVARREHRQAELPHLGQRAPTTAREFHAFIAVRRGRVLLRQRPPGVVNAGLWEFPNAEGATWPEVAKQLGLAIATAEPICELRHSITRSRIRLKSWRATLKRNGRRLPGTQWVELAEAATFAYPAAHRKILDRVWGAARPGGQNPAFAGRALDRCGASI